MLPYTVHGNLSKGMENKSPWMRFIKEFNLNWLPQSISQYRQTRHYYELQLRDLEALTSGTSVGNGDISIESIPISVAKEFLWNRDFALRWDLTKSLRFNFTSATHAEIVEPYGVVNKDLYPDEYTAWKDTVRRSLSHLAVPSTSSRHSMLPINSHLINSLPLTGSVQISALLLPIIGIVVSLYPKA